MVKTMSTHQASEQMLGYLYQVRCALDLLLNTDNEDYQISIEQFDDVDFRQNGTPKQLIQLKHHVRQHGNLSDASTDIWRTLNVWIDKISASPSLLQDTNFLIITTATSPENSAASLLKYGIRNVDLAYEKLNAIATSSENKNHKKYYEAFSSLDVATIKNLLNHIYIIDKSSNINDISNNLRRAIRYSCKPNHEDQICEQIEGWWFQCVIEALCSDTPVFYTQRQLRTKIVSISHQFTDETLPIDVFRDDDFINDDIISNKKNFCEQLKLIRLGDNSVKIAIRDYYRSFTQRAIWVRNELLYTNELDDYDYRLIDEWEHHFASMEDNLSILAIPATEEDKIREGQALFKKIREGDIRIRPKVQDAFVMRGSYHILANQLKVGWHVDFQERITQNLSIQKRGTTHEELE